MTTTTTNRDYSRQEGLVPTDRIESQPVTIIGLGAGGRPLALLLASVGCRRFTLIDHDSVDASNHVTQSYPKSNIGAPKTTATAAALLLYDPEIIVEERQALWSPDLTKGQAGQVVFCCVDTMHARRIIHARLARMGDNEFFCEGRMSGLTYYIHTSTPATRDQYRASLFDDTEAEPGRCTAKSTAFCGSLAACQMVNQYVRWLSGKDPDSKVGGYITATHAE